MDAIKKKMQSLKSETENALGRAAQLEAEAKDANTRAEKTEEHVSLDTIKTGLQPVSKPVKRVRYLGWWRRGSKSLLSHSCADSYIAGYASIDGSRGVCS